MRRDRERSHRMLSQMLTCACASSRRTERSACSPRARARSWPTSATCSGLESGEGEGEGGGEGEGQLVAVVAVGDGD